ncbi:MAG: hypothetical protein JW987_11425 [Anaerolineaceae bacterium]|nr:hypothetical protein [Anaerolineaceae bacterium]
MSFALAAILVLSACTNPTATPTPTTEPVWLKVQYPASLGNLSADFTACVPDGVGLVVQEGAGMAFDEEEADLVLGWAAPESVLGYAAELGSEELVVIVHSENKIPSLDIEDLRLVYAGQLTDWDFLGQSPLALQAWAPLATSDMWALFAEAALGPDLTLGRVVGTATSPQAMREAVAADTGALGVLPRRWVDSSVRIVPINDLPVGSLVRPILAFSASEPQGPARAWLACLQGRLE